MIAPSLRPQHLKRYKDILRLMRYLRSDLLKGAELRLLEPDEEGPDRASDAERFAAELEALGPTFIKLGQLLSTRADLLPAAYLEALARLQDQVAPFSFQEVEQIVASELSVRLSKAFSSFEPTPLA